MSQSSMVGDAPRVGLDRMIRHLAGTLALATICRAQEPKPSPAAKSGFREQTEVYKTIGDVQLRIHVLTPTAESASKPGRPAVVFFFGGGWNGGRIEQFRPQAEYMASRGMIAALADYRVRSRHGTTPFACVADGKSAVRWLRTHSERLGIDPRRIAAAGGSAGGHVAATTGVVPGLEEVGESTAVSSRADALVLFNPVFDNGPGGYGHERLGDRWREISPLHNIAEDAPPTIVFLGTKDSLIPVATGKRYRDRMRAVGARCDLHLYEGQPHGFFNQNRNARCFALTVREMDRFFGSLGWLEGEPTIPVPEVKPAKGAGRR